MRTSLRAVPATARSMAWAPLVGAIAAVAVLLLAQRPWDDHELSLGLARLAVAVVAVGAALSIDDAAAVTVASSPTPLSRRRAVRWALAAAGAAGGAGVALGAVSATAGARGVPFDRLALEGAGILLLALALAAVLGGDEGALVFAAGLLGAILVQQRWPEYSLFPMAPGTPGWAGAAAAWSALAVASAGALVVVSRDPWGGIRATNRL